MLSEARLRPPELQLLRNVASGEGYLPEISPVEEYNSWGYSSVMYAIVPHRRPDGSYPYEEYVRNVYYSGRKRDAAKIRALVDLLSGLGSQQLIAMRKAEKMNDVWQLRPGSHRIFYFWHAQARRYVLLNGFRKKSGRTPRSELNRAESLRTEHLCAEGDNDGEPRPAG